MSDKPSIVAAQGASSILPFGTNSDAQYAYKKAERIVTAIYLVTNFVPENEPLRNYLRNKSLFLLSDILLLRYGFRSVKPEYVNDIIAHTLELVSLLEIANAAGYLSRMNLIILQQESVRLCDFLRSREDTTSAEGMALSDMYFSVPKPDTKPAARDRIGVSSKARENEARDYKGHEAVKDKSRSFPRRTKGQKGPSATAAKRSARRTAILALFKKKPRVSVRDVMMAARGYSEKTLQRELISLVKEGVLKREGERRWSSYSLANATAAQRTRN